MPAPSIPRNFAVYQANNQVQISCDAVAGATTYPIQRSTDNVSFSALAAPAVPYYTDTTVVQGTIYYYRIASDNGSTSDYTNSIKVIPCQSGLLSLYELRQKSRERADRQESDFVTDTELNGYINQSQYELYDILTTVYEDYNMEQPVLFQTNGTDQQYTLPNGNNSFQNSVGGAITPRPFYKMLGVDCGIALNSNAWASLHKFDFISRNRYVYPNVSSTYLGVFNLRYRVMANTIMFIPNPSAGQYIRLWYVPRLQELLKDNDLSEGVNGWTEYIITDAAIKILQKEESDVSVLMAQKQMLIDRIQSTAMNRDAGQPDSISDVRSYSNQAGGWGPAGGDGSFGGY